MSINQVIAYVKCKTTGSVTLMMKIILVFSFLFSILTCQGQDSSIIDSLKNVLLSTKEDTTKVNCLLHLSKEYIDANDFAAAMQYADSALSLASGKNFKPGLAKAYHNIGRIHNYQGNYQEAINNYLTSVEINDEIGNKLGAAKSHSSLFALYDDLYDSTQCMYHLTAAKKLLEEIGDKAGLAALTLNIGGMEFHKDHYMVALNYFKDALSLFEEINEKKGVAMAFKNIGEALKYLGNYPEALANYNRSMEIYEEIGDKRGMATSNLAIGSLHSLQGNYSVALKFQFIALEVFEEIGDKTYVAKTNMTIANAYNYQGNYPKALEYYYTTFKIAEELGNKSLLANCLNNIGTINLSLAEYQEAMKNYQSALKIFIEIDDKKLIASAYSNIGVIYDLQGNENEALKYYFSSLKITEEIGDKAGMADAYSNIGIIFNEQGDDSQALKYLLLSLNTNEELGNRAGMATTLSNIGIIYKSQGSYDDARKYLNEGLALALKIGTKSEIKLSYKELYKLDSVEANYVKALEHYKLYILYKDSLNNKESQQQIAGLKLQFESEKKDKEIELLNKDNEIKSLQISKQKALRHGLIAGIVLLFIAGHLLFRSFRLRKKLEQQQAIISERKRISADLHDDVGSGLSRIMLLTELVKNEAKTPETRKEAEKIAAISRELSANISEIIWALNANNDNMESLLAYIRRYAAEFFENSVVKLKISTRGDITQMPISGELRREIFYSVKEALHNIYKHSQATEAALDLSVTEEALEVVIRDNGVGMPEVETGRYGNGINNMRQRMAVAGGSISIENEQGTKITLTVPIR